MDSTDQVTGVLPSWICLVITLWCKSLSCQGRHSATRYHSRYHPKRKTISKQDNSGWVVPYYLLKSRRPAVPRSNGHYGTKLGWGTVTLTWITAWQVGRYHRYHGDRGANGFEQRGTTPSALNTLSRKSIAVGAERRTRPNTYFSLRERFGVFPLQYWYLQMYIFCPYLPVKTSKIFVVDDFT